MQTYGNTCYIKSVLYFTDRTHWSEEHAPTQNLQYFRGYGTRRWQKHYEAELSFYKYQSVFHMLLSKVFDKDGHMSESIDPLW